MKNALWIPAVWVACLASCDRQAGEADRNGGTEGAGKASALLVDARGKKVGTANLSEVEGGVRVELEAAGLSPGPHGFHIHKAGDCHGPDFRSAGGHFNPFNRKHGLENPGGAHAGDLPNLVAGEDGTARADVVAKGVTLRPGPASLLRPGGTSLVIHERADDGKTDPDGNAGGRVACGVIRGEGPSP